MVKIRRMAYNAGLVESVMGRMHIYKRQSNAVSTDTSIFYFLILFVDLYPMEVP
jgi:hypothetical protein